MIETVEGFRKELESARAHGRTVGLVPTMGALHAGHLSLLRRAVVENDLAALTIFVNPLQFGPSEDLASYPRDLAADVAAASAEGAAVVFAPPVEEMLPVPAATSVHVSGLSEWLEGASRPGHLDGVATVVAKLFAIAGPCRAYFGEKDFQQLLVVCRMAQDLSFPVDVRACPTVREPDGLACSSRNSYLSGPQRSAATVLHRALGAGARAFDAGERDAAVLRRMLVDAVGSEPLATLDYAEVADSRTLESLEAVGDSARLLVAARVGGIRLIDNVGVEA